MSYPQLVLKAILGTILAWLPTSPELALEKAYLFPIYLGATFAGVFYFQKEICLLPRDLITQNERSWSKVFLYSSLFTLIIGYPLGKTLGTLGVQTLIIVDVALGVVLLILGTLERVPLNLPGDIKDFFLSFLVGTAQGLSSPGPSRALTSLITASIIESDVRDAVGASLLASPAYFALRAVLLKESGLVGADGIILSSVSFFLSLIIIHSLLKLAAHGRKFLVGYALISLISILWR
ncbi:bacitracin resistance protein BacA [Thermococcus zilligii]|uniref:bacitracin resistance protein BacA n=1 Tax=Thermococcus zilligii TaxID=54076 RepID=UPI00029AAA47|nr:bacitracin resistance protein BacA [Thermococcus zilligii]